MNVYSSTDIEGTAGIVDGQQVSGLGALHSSEPMSPLFRKSAEKREQAAAAQAEIDRIKRLSTVELGEILLPALGVDGFSGGHSVRLQQLCDYLLRDHLPPRNTQALQLMARVRAALERLGRADLVTPTYLQRQPVYQITPEGQSALADGATSRLLGRSE
jgi:hypothetical protein